MGLQRAFEHGLLLACWAPTAGGAGAGEVEVDGFEAGFFVGFALALGFGGGVGVFGELLHLLEALGLRVSDATPRIRNERHVSMAEYLPVLVVVRAFVGFEVVHPGIAFLA